MIKSTGFKSRFVKFLNKSHREDFLSILPKNAVGAEIGVFKGEFSYQLLKRTNPKVLHLIDVWWKKYGDFFPDWGEYTNNGKLKTRDAYEQTLKTVSRFKNKTIVHCVQDGIELLETFEDSYFDWVYLDSSHDYEHTRAELNILARKMKSEAMITGHDWQPDSSHIHHGVYKAVCEFCDRYGWEVFSLDEHTQWALKRKPTV